VVCLASLAPAQDPAEILQKAREKLVRFTRNLTKYTCIETVDREYFAQPPRKGHLLTDDAAPSCPAIPPESTGSTPTVTDRLRLEVAVSESREIHAWPGAREFDIRPIDELVDGPISTGGFGTYLIEIFDNPGTHITYIGKTAPNGRTLFEYAYRTPLSDSHYRISKLRRLTAHGGSFQIDLASLDLVQLKIATDPTPPETGMCVSHTQVEYHRVPIGDGELVLPIQSAMEILEPGSSVSRAVTTFSACHEYLAESSIRFDDDGDSSAGKPQAADAPAALLARIHFTLANVSPIDLSTAAAGDRISARVTYTSNKKLLPGGAIVTARLTAVRHFVNVNRFQITISPRSVAVGNTSVRLAAAIDRNVTIPAQGFGRFQTRGQVLDVPPPTGVYEGSFAIAGSTKIVKAGFQSSWVTVAP